MFAFALSEPVQLAITAGFFTALGLVMNHMFRRSDRKADERERIRVEEARKQAVAVDEVARRAAEAASKVEKVASDLKVSDNNQAAVIDGIVKGQEIQMQVINDTHTLVNNNMGIQLRLNADNARFRADTTRKPRDIEAADLAESMLKDHEAKQAIVDKGNSDREAKIK